MSWARNKYNNSGFTIVELLIVVVVIAVLAAITVVAYTGVSTNASNSAVKSAASQSLKLLSSYASTTNSYPPIDPNNPVWTFVCLTPATGCHTDLSVVSEDATFTQSINTIGSLPGNVFSTGSNRYGVMYQYHPSRTVSGQSQPAVVIYYLQGTDQQCGLPGVIIEPVTGSVEYVPSTTGYTHGNAAGKTVCYITIPGPAHSS